MSTKPWTKDQSIAYLAAMIDGEGWIGELKGTTNRAIRIANTEEDIITGITECLDHLGITYRIVREKENPNPRWAKRITVDITGLKNLSYILEHVHFRSVRKRARLGRLVASYRRPVDVDAVRHLYIEKGMSDKQVAEALGVGIKRVRNVRRWHNIEGHSYAERAPLAWAERKKRYGSRGRSTD